MKGRTGFGEDLERVERMLERILERIWRGFGQNLGGFERADRIWRGFGVGGTDVGKDLERIWRGFWRGLCCECRQADINDQIACMNCSKTSASGRPSHVAVHNLPLDVDSNCIHVEFLQVLEARIELLRLEFGRGPLACRRCTSCIFFQRPGASLSVYYIIYIFLWV